MAKEFFRFLRGELNGFYINSINNTIIKLTNTNKEELIKFSKQQFEANKMDSATLYNLGRFAGVRLPRKPASEAKSSLRMTESHKVNGIEFSERGLYCVNSEDFYFVHTDQSITTPDINTLASETERSSLIGDEHVLGYISEDARNVIDDEGRVRPDKILSEPPVGKAYSNYYGDDFLFLSEGEVTYESISFALYIELFKALQWIRYNGASLASLAQVIHILCPERFVLITDIRVADNKKVINVFYAYDGSAMITNKEQRFALLQYIISLKFKQVRFVEA